MAKMIDEDDELFFFNSDGKVVFTAQYLLNRGYCCGNGCTNCPYDFKNVPEPKRTRLIHERGTRKPQ